MKNLFAILTLLLTVPLLSQNVIADFEVGGASQITADGGAVSIVTGTGTNTTQVAELTNVGGTFENYAITLTNNLSLANDQVITLDFYNPDPTNHLVWIRLNGATTDQDVLVSQTSSAGPGWETLTFDFANAVIQSGCFCDPIDAQGTYDEMFLFIDGGTNETSVTAVDNIEGGEASVPPAMIDITFTVNMNGAAIAPTGIFIAKGVFGDAFLNPMFDDGTNGDAVAGDGIYTIVSTQPEGFSGEYIFTNGACGDYSCGESLAGLPCATGPDNVRFIDPIQSDTTLQHCFSNCSTDGSCTVTNVDVTFTVNMANEVTDPSGVFIAGGTDFGVPGDNPMFDDGTNGDLLAGDDIWTIVRSVPQGYTGLYAFANGACSDFSCKESLVGLPCANGPFSDRSVGPVSENTLVQACFGQCTTDGSCEAPGEDVEITFSVNMANETVAPTGVFIAGGTTFGAPGVNQMFDNGMNGDLIAGDNVYSITVTRPSGFIGNYTFTNGNCPDYSCKEQIGGQDCADGPFNDRIVGPVSENTTVATCFGECTTDGSCPAPAPMVAITFSVNMANETVSPQGVFIAGGGNFGNPGDNQLFDDGLGNDFIAGDGVYTTTIMKPQGFSGNYVFTNGACPDYSCKEQLVGLACADGPFADRFVVPIQSDTTLLHCFNECSTDGSCPVILNPGCTDPTALNWDPAAETNDGSCMYMMTLAVDMNCAPTFGTVNVVGPNVNGQVWCGACNPMFDDGTNGDAIAGDGIYSLSLPLSGDFEYKYAIDNFAGQENLIDDMQNGGSCAPITDFFSFANRQITASGTYNEVDAYGTCGPCGEDANVALPISSSVFGVASWSTHTLGESQSMPGCDGDADDDLWFSFVANSPNDMIIAGDPANSFDAVVEVFDGFMGASLGCFNNYGAGLLERVTPTGLVPGQEYYFRAYDAGSGAGASTEIRVQVKTFEDSEVNGAYCGETYTLDQSIYAERDDLGQLYANPNVPVGGYRFLFEEQGGGLSVEYATADFTPYITLANVPGLDYGTTYDVSVQHLVRNASNGTINEYWSAYGTSCPISLAAAAPSTQLRAEFCSALDLTLSNTVLADVVQGASQYRFTFTGGGQTLVKVSNNYALQLYTVGNGGLQYNTSYMVSVEANVNGAWSPIGTVCNIGMAAAPQGVNVQEAYCGSTYMFPAPNFLLAEQVLGAEEYTFRFIPVGGGAIQEQVRPGLSLPFHLTQLNLVAGQYDVTVKVKVGGVYGDYLTNPCIITIDDGSFEVEAVQNDDELDKANTLASASAVSLYPNPNEGDQIAVNLTDLSDEYQQILVEVVDYTGKVIYTEQVVNKGANANFIMSFDSKLASGMYFVNLFVDEARITEKFIVK